MVPKCQRDILRIYLLKGRACATQDGIKFISSTLTLSKNALYFFCVQSYYKKVKCGKI